MPELRMAPLIATTVLAVGCGRIAADSSPAGLDASGVVDARADAPAEFADSADGLDTVCVEHHFDAHDPINPVCEVQAAWVALPFTADCTLDLGSVEIQGTFGQFAILADNHGQPG